MPEPRIAGFQLKNAPFQNNPNVSSRQQYNLVAFSEETVYTNFQPASSQMARKSRQSPIEQEIDENLRRVYQQVIDLDVPDRFTQLLDQLRQQEQDRGPNQ